MGLITLFSSARSVTLELLSLAKSMAQEIHRLLLAASIADIATGFAGGNTLILIAYNHRFETILGIGLLKKISLSHWGI